MDYSRFYYRGRPKESEGRENEPEGRSPFYCAAPPRRKKRGKKKFGKAVFTLVVIVLSFSLVFFAADFFGKGVLSEWIKKALSGATYEYHFVVTPASSRYVAYAGSLEVRQGGGGGYIIGSDDYYVAYSVYTDKTTALAVQTKNRSTEIYTVKYRSKEELARQVDVLVSDLEKSVSDWDRGAIGETDVSAVIRANKEIFSGYRTDYTDKKSNLVELIVEGLDGFSLSATEKITQLSKLRYFMCCVVLSARDVFG